METVPSPVPLDRHTIQRSLSLSLSFSVYILLNFCVFTSSFIYLFFFLRLSRIRELAELHASIGNDVPELTPSDFENLLKDFTLDLEVLLKLPLHFRPFQTH